MLADVNGGVNATWLSFERDRMGSNIRKRETGTGMVKLYRLSGSGDLGSESAGRQVWKVVEQLEVERTTWELHDSSAPRHHGACLTVELPLVSPQLRIFFGPDDTSRGFDFLGRKGPLRLYRPTPLSIPFFFLTPSFFVSCSFGGL